MSLRHGGHETVSGYKSRFRRTLLQLHTAQVSALPDLTVVTSYQEGLRPEFQVALERDQPNTLALPSRQPGRSPKLSPRYKGPYRVIRRLSDVLYEISHLETGAVTTAHVQRLQQYLSLDPHVAAPSLLILLHDDSISDTKSLSLADAAGRSTAATVSSARPVRNTAGIPAQRFADL